MPTPKVDRVKGHGALTDTVRLAFWTVVWRLLVFRRAVRELVWDHRDLVDDSPVTPHTWGAIEATGVDGVLRLNHHHSVDAATLRTHV